MHPDPLVSSRSHSDRIFNVPMFHFFPSRLFVGTSRALQIPTLAPIGDAGLCTIAQVFRTGPLYLGLDTPRMTHASQTVGPGDDPNPRERRDMLLYAQTWLPLVTITLTAAIFFTIASFMIARARP